MEGKFQWGGRGEGCNKADTPPPVGLTPLQPQNHTRCPSALHLFACGTADTTGCRRARAVFMNLLIYLRNFFSRVYHRHESKLVSSIAA
eukprot:753754-Hanusia_phi.AAC.1